MGPCPHHWLLLLGYMVKVRVPAAFYGCLTLKKDGEAAAQHIYIQPVTQSDAEPSVTGSNFPLNPEGAESRRNRGEKLFS